MTIIMTMVIMQRLVHYSNLSLKTQSGVIVFHPAGLIMMMVKIKVEDEDQMKLMKEKEKKMMMMMMRMRMRVRVVMMRKCW